MPSNFELFKKQLDEAVELIDESVLMDETNYPAILDEALDTQSLLDRCETICQKHEPKKPTIRIIHHLACSGGAELAQYISAMPNVYLLNEVHPFLVASRDSPSLELTSAVKNTKIPLSSKLNGQLFLENIKNIYQHVTQLGLNLVIRDNAYYDYLFSEEISNQSILKLLEEDFNVISVVLYRDTIDSFSSLACADFFKNRTLSFNEYCDRVLTFISDYSSAKLVKYEDLCASPEKTVETICEYFQIGFNDSFELMSFEINMPLLDRWKASDIDCYNTKLKTCPDMEDVGSSESYFILQNLLKPKDKRLILIATMPRSGSTWLFNCVREIHKSKKLDFYSCWIDDYSPSNPSKIHIVKVHSPEHRLSSQADVIISTRRDIRNVLVSLMRMGWIENEETTVLKEAARLVDSVHPFWKNKSNFEIEYTRILNEPNNLVDEVCSVLEIESDKATVDDVLHFLAETKAPTKYDKETQLHPNHISSMKTDFRSELSPDIVNKIEVSYRKWLTDNAYL
ncbi:sulfotransferase domain-containing protein [Shewanella metallivivens]|uniref:Sulfotransferase domain-containing protein n=1 Tax=Shewanella metallivivens TaxID=2872342 RepID=A0ABT5TL50_9GAMM|nr:sulfotransferase domain-containing protein [Shewanella metallivivens]MDD8059335.1 sulfotransferase domain-containing protein [Shewanella metallivivens]